MRRLLRVILNFVTVLSAALCLTAVTVWARSGPRMEGAGYRWTAADADGKTVCVRTVAAAWDQRWVGLRAETFRYEPSGGGSVEDTVVDWRRGDGGWAGPMRRRDLWLSDPFFGDRFDIGFGELIWRASVKADPDRRLVVGWRWLILTTAVLPVIRVARLGRCRLFRRGPNRAGHCPACNYDCRATPERCPECGTELKANAKGPRGQGTPREDGGGDP